MAYRIVNNGKTIIQYTILDFFLGITWELINRQTPCGRARYRELFRRTRVKRVSRASAQVQPLKAFFIHQEAIQYLTGIFNERDRRLFAGFLATVSGDGGVQGVKQLTGLDVKTIQRGQEELADQAFLPGDRVRQPGGGRLTKEREDGRYKATLESLIADDVAGDPMSDRKWVRRTLRWMQEELRGKKINAALSTIRKTLKGMKISLKKNMKTINNQDHPQRDEQFQYLNKLKKEFLEAGKPVISVDTKKKEQIGNFSNKGRTWRKNARETLDHDFPSLAKGKLIPSGIYDVEKNKGYIYGGTSIETPQFIVEAITRWWVEYGQEIHAGQTELLILCDSGGANGYRRRGWKWEIQIQLVDSHGLTVTICHYPPGASKWNPIERCLFSYISLNWAGEPLTSYEKALGFIRSTKTAKGLEVEACLMDKPYEKGLEVTDEQMGSLNIDAHQPLIKWNYTIKPR